MPYKVARLVSPTNISPLILTREFLLTLLAAKMTGSVLMLLVLRYTFKLRVLFRHSYSVIKIELLEWLKAPF